MRGNNNKSGQNDFNHFSPMLITAYSRRASGFISSVVRFLYVLLAVLIVFALVSMLDMAIVWGFVQFLSDDQLDFAVLVLAFVTIGIIAVLLKHVINLRNKMNRWYFAFERNSIMASINLRLSKLERMEILNSIIDTIPEIGIPLKKYIMNNGDDIGRFTDQSVPGNPCFDLLIDDTKIASDDNGKNDYLKDKIERHGAIIVKVENDGSAVAGRGGIIDIKTSELFVQSILRYAKTTKKFVGLALLCGSYVTEEAAEFMSNYSNKSIGHLISIGKPIVLDSGMGLESSSSYGS
jgi:hypothetical protein